MLSSASDLRLFSVVSRTEEGQRDLATSLEWSSSTERGGSMASPLLSLSSDLQTKFPVEAGGGNSHWGGDKISLRRELGKLMVWSSSRTMSKCAL